eukprot:PITA_19115
MEEEIISLLKNKTWELVNLPKGRKDLQNKWVYNIKHEGDEKKEKYKARLVVKGFSQKEGINFTEFFLLVVKMSSIRVILGLLAALDLECEQLDVKIAFLHGELEEEIYMQQPEDFIEKGKEGLVCRLKKSLYGLKQAPQQWYMKFDSFMLKHGFQRLEADHCVYIKRYDQGKYIILLLYLDDMLIIGHDKNKINRLKKDLGRKFAIKDLGPAQQMLGMWIMLDRKNKTLWLSQEKYIKKVLDRLNMKVAKLVGTPLVAHFKLSIELCPSDDKEKEEMSKIPYASVVGSLMFAMVCTRLDIAYSVGVVNANMARDMDTTKSTTGYLYTFAGATVSWVSRLQRILTLSTTKAYYIAATEACKDMLWMQRFLGEIGIKKDKYVLYCDSQSAIHLAKNPTFHSKTKHIDLRYHWIRHVLEEEQLSLETIHTDRNPADTLTKILPRNKHELCRGMVGLGVT